MMSVTTIRSVCVEIIVLLFVLSGICSLVARTEEFVQEENVGTTQTRDILDNQSNPQATSEFRSPGELRDPFRPFIKLVSEEKESGDGSLVPPIRRYELHEFRIAGILWIEGEPRAMVVDPEKNTYYLAVGDEIGNMGGVILEIRESGMLVKETRRYEDLFGESKVEVRKVVLSFQE